MAIRNDSIGLFWQDEKKVKPPKQEKVKREPPFPFWLEPTYLPGLEEARNFKPDLFTDQELIAAAANKEPLLFDTESYPNFWLAAFKSFVTGKVIYFEMFLDPFEGEFNLPKFKWILENFCIINFNGRKYDFPVTSLVLSGKCGTEDMWDADPDNYFISTTCK